MQYLSIDPNLPGGGEADPDFVICVYNGPGYCGIYINTDKC